MHKAPHLRVWIEVFLGRARLSLSLQGQLPVQRRHSGSGCVLGTRLELVRWIFSALCSFQCVRKTNWETAARLVRVCVDPSPSFLHSGKGSCMCVNPSPVVPACVLTPPRHSSCSGKGSCACVDPFPAIPSSNSGEKLCLVPDSGGSLDRGNTSRQHKP